MKTFKQLLSEMDHRFGTPEDPRLNIHDPIYDRTSSYDPEYYRVMSTAGDSLSPRVSTRSDNVAQDPNARLVDKRDKPQRTSAEIARMLGIKSRQAVDYHIKTALEKFKKAFIQLAKTDPDMQKLISRFSTKRDSE